jgi:hypothetical protein
MSKKLKCTFCGEVVFSSQRHWCEPREDHYDPSIHHGDFSEDLSVTTVVGEEVIVEPIESANDEPVVIVRGNLLWNEDGTVRFQEDQNGQHQLNRPAPSEKTEPEPKEEVNEGGKEGLFSKFKFTLFGHPVITEPTLASSQEEKDPSELIEDQSQAPGHLSV